MSETPWYILRVAPQRERWLANELRVARGLHTYVPIERIVVTLRGKRIERRRPLVPGYVFVLGVGENAWRDLAETRYVTGWLSIGGGRPYPVKDEQVGIIRIMEQEYNQALQARRARPVFKAGDRVRPKDGPFASIDSLLQSVRGSTGIIEVHMLGSTRKAKVKLDQLEKVA